MANPISTTTTTTPTRTILRLAIISRLLILTLTILSRLLFRPYDTSASLHPPCLVPTNTNTNTKITNSSSPLFPLLAAAIESGVVWDGVHFTRIAECGYEYEHSYAFLPLLPFAMAALSRSVFAPLVPLIGYRAVLVVSGYVVNNIAFVLAALYFYRLSVLILKDSAAAFRASVLFCFNPASIFYSSLYSESLYALLSLGGLFYLFSGAQTIAMILLAMSGSARSNGALSAGYFCFQALLQAYNAIIQKKRPTLAVGAIIAAVLRSIILFVPFLAFQAYGYYNICPGGHSEELRPWCKAKVPFLYGFIQSHYWGVGFLRYFQVKQLPNFLLASPTLTLAVCSIGHYAKALHRQLQSTGIHKHAIRAAEEKSLEADVRSDVASVLKEKPLTVPPRQSIVRHKKSERKEKASESIQNIRSTEKTLEVKQQENSLSILPFIAHLAFLTSTAFFVMHVQVATRFLSASPPIYWFASNLLVSPISTSKRCGYLICVYYIAYILLGTLLFSNFYPFT